MPQADRTPKTLRPFTFHGVHFSISGDEATAEECPFCGREGKFGVRVDTGQYHCFVCGADGNAATFLRDLHANSGADAASLEELRADRNLLAAETLLSWGLRVSAITGEWLMPGWGPGGKLDQLYAFRTPLGSRKRILTATSEVEHGLLGVPLFDPKKTTTYLAESWNALTLWEACGIARRTEDGSLRLTGDVRHSLLSTCNVLGVPGANVFKERWVEMLRGQHVVLMIDSDHPTKEGRDGAGVAGAKRTAGMLAGVAASISVLRWGEAWYDPAKKSGWDARDFLSAAAPVDRVRQLGELLSMIAPAPEEWAAKADRGHGGLEPMACESWHQLLNFWRRAMRWTPDLERMLGMFLAAVISTDTKGEQIWLLGMAPPSSGKTTLCEAIATAREWVVCRSVLRSVYSGYKESKDDTTDHGEVPNLLGKTLIVMDGNTLLKDPARASILAQYRGLYDGVARVKYNNGAAFSREGIRFSKIICGTAAMMEVDSAEYGARYINVCFSDEVDVEHERSVNRKVIFRAFRNTKAMANGTAETRIDPDLAAAKRATGGFVQHLRHNAEELMSRVDTESPEAEAAGERIVAMGEFTAMLRARPPKFQDEASEREMSHRLVEQFGRLGVCLAAVLGKPSVADEEVLAWVRQAALDTAKGRALLYATILRDRGQEGASVASLSVATGESEEKVRPLVDFMTKIGAVERFEDPRGIGAGKRRWRLTKRMRTLFEEVC